MRTLGPVLVALVAVAAAGCLKLDTFHCIQSSQCQDGDVLGSCEPGGLCSFPDPACPSGKKFGGLAGALSGQCVDEAGDSTATTSAPTTAPTSTTTPTSTGPDLTSTSLDPGTTTSTSEVGATTTTSTGATTTDETTGGPSCGQVGEACVDGQCCGGCATCDDRDTCVPLGADADEKVCGVCSFCGADGECAPSSNETPCPADCGDIVWQERYEGPKSACYAYPSLAVTSLCDGDGACAPLDPIAAGCPDPNEMPGIEVKLAECDIVCLENDGFCVPGAPASEVTLDSYCLLDGINDDCHPHCSPDDLAVVPAKCDQGVCTAGVPEPCGVYFCDDATSTCLAACDSDADCAAGICVEAMCQ